MEALKNWMIYIGSQKGSDSHQEIRSVLEHYEKNAAMLILERMFHLTTQHICDYSVSYLKDLRKEGMDLCTIFDEDYPIELKNIYDYPLCLFLRGNRKRLADPHKISIIGTRKPTYDGMKMCDLFVRDLSKVPFTVVSGLAFGIDLCAHKSALNYHCPAIAVLASGIDDITPRSNERIGLQLLDQGGLLISEYPPKSKVYKANFVIRNRIISGLSMDLFVVEAGCRSGSLTTARHALSQSRNIYAMPGSISNPVAQGTNDLIRQGATVITQTEDFEPYRLWREAQSEMQRGIAIGPKERKSSSKEEKAPSLREKLLNRIVKSGRTTVEELLSAFPIKEGELMSCLMELEIMDEIELFADDILSKR